VLRARVRRQRRLTLSVVVRRLVVGTRVSEALTNVVLHAYLGRDPGPMVAEAWCDADHLLVRVCDEGQGLVPRVDSPGLGVGIAVMASVADDFRIGNRDGTAGTVVSLRFSRAGQWGAA
jgi:serine/threonine-protein kinase RsbW